MIPVIAIAASLLAILDDDNAPPDINELFQRAVMFENAKILLDRLSIVQRAEFLQKFAAARCAAPADQKEWWNMASRLFIPTSYSICYEIVTPESAEDGEASERGYIVEGHKIDIPDDLYGEKYREWAIEQGVDMLVSADDWWEYEPGDDPLLAEARAMAKILIDDGFHDEGGGNYMTSPEQDMWSGSDETRSAGLQGFSDQQQAWISILVKIGNPGADLP